MSAAVVATVRVAEQWGAGSAFGALVLLVAAAVGLWLAVRVLLRK